MKNREVKIMMKGIQHDFSEEGIEHRYVGNYTQIADSHIYLHMPGIFYTACQKLIYSKFYSKILIS